MIEIDTLKILIEQMKNYIPPMTLTYIGWVTLHFISSHMYVKYCVGDTIVDFFLSPIRSASPICQAFSWTSYTLSKQFITILISCGSYMCSKMMLDYGKNSKMD
jgi:hypothetical protein